MSLPVRRSRQADDDLDSIWSYIAKDNVAAAERLVKRVVEAEERLGRIPPMGQARPDLRVGLRHWTVRPYLILYRVDPDAVTIVRIVHGARDLLAALGD